MLDLNQRTSHAASSDERRLSQVTLDLAGNAFADLFTVTALHNNQFRVMLLSPGRHPWFLPCHVIGARIASTDANGNRAACCVIRPWALQSQRLGVSPAKPRGPVSDRAKRRDQAAKRRLGPAGLAT